MLKRTIDIGLSVLGLVSLSPLMLFACLAIFLQDFRSPFYIAPKEKKNEKTFKMIKLRSMIVHADKTGVDSTGANDRRITALGKLIRKFKLDELPQLWNVFKSEMSLVGPRPNVKRETDLYTSEEKKILEIRPGITDLASIVFADLGDILNNSQNPNLDYNQLIRPVKSRLGIFYRQHHNLAMDVKLIYLTLLNSVSRVKALQGIQNILKKYKSAPELIEWAGRQKPLVPLAPPGSDQIVARR